MERKSFTEQEIKSTFDRCTTAQELTAARENLIEEIGRTEACDVETIRRAYFEKRAIVRELSSKRLAKIKEANRLQWKLDRTEMWEEAANTCTPNTIKSILQKAKERGTIESYNVEMSSGEVLKGSRQ